MLGLLHVLPSLLILAAVGLVIFGLQKTTEDQQVLGAQINVEIVKTETREERIKALEQSYKKSGSLEIKSQLDSLR
jgi:hypothetical protein